MNYKPQFDKINYLTKLPSHYELLLVSFFVTNKKALIKLLAQWAKRDAEHKKYVGRSKKDYKTVSSKTFGGSIALIDPKNFELGLIAEIKCPVATGMYYRKEENILYVGSNKWIQKIRGGKIIGTLGNNLFNDIHSLSESFDKKLLITSTGVDAILEINWNNPKQIVWDWFATENGYDKTPTGKKRIINKTLNYQKITTTTPEHTTHINSCLHYKKNKLLAVLFHQGQLVEIDKRTKKTKILLNNLRCPHFIRKRRRGYLICDSRNNRVIILDKFFKIEKTINDNFNWPQDAIELRNGDLIIGDSNNYRIVRFSKNGDKIATLQMEKCSRKIFSFLSVSKSEALKIFGIKTN